MTKKPESREEQVAEVVAKAPVKYRGWVIRATEGSAPPRGAIKAFCLTCTSYDRPEITNCQVYRCPLWLYRPYQDK